MFRNDKISNAAPLSRRLFMGSAVAAGLATAWPSTAWAMAGITRKSLQGGNAGPDLAIYQQAVKMMLNLPPEDPRNWYRHAITHMMDCPHGNWWFLVWHRGYLGWLEKTCREMTGEEKFALPYWDWTKETKVPNAFWSGVLNPSAPEYETSVTNFRSKFRDAVEAQWNAFTVDQIAQQMTRGANVPPVIAYSNFAEFWSSAEFHFFGNAQSRNLTQANPEFNPSAKDAVEESTIIDALSPREFVSNSGGFGFESAESDVHHGRAPKSIIESQSHDQVHGAIGGLMGRWLSPVDPIFFMHHCNIDRLWDVWSRKQAVNNRPDGPPTHLEAKYKSEPFLFFHDENGNAAPMTTAADYIDISVFDYDYEPGTGEDQVQPLLALSTQVSDEVAGAASAFDIAAPGQAFLVLSTELAARINTADTERFFATVSITPPEDVRDLEFLVFIGKEGGAIDTDVDSKNFAGSLSFFGDVAHGMGPAVFNIGITEAVRNLRAAGDLTEGDPLQISVVPQARPGSAALSSNAEGALTSVVIGTL